MFPGLRIPRKSRLYYVIVSSHFSVILKSPHTLIKIMNNTKTMQRKFREERIANDAAKLDHRKLISGDSSQLHNSLQCGLLRRNIVAFLLSLLRVKHAF